MPDVQQGAVATSDTGGPRARIYRARVFWLVEYLGWADRAGGPIRLTYRIFKTWPEAMASADVWTTQGRHEHRGYSS